MYCVLDASEKQNLTKKKKKQPTNYLFFQSSTQSKPCMPVVFCFLLKIKQKNKSIILSEASDSHFIQDVRREKHTEMKTRCLRSQRVEMGQRDEHQYPFSEDGRLSWAHEWPRQQAAFLPSSTGGDWKNRCCTCQNPEWPRPSNGSGHRSLEVLPSAGRLNQLMCAEWVSSRRCPASPVKLKSAFWGRSGNQCVRREQHTPFTY